MIGVSFTSWVEMPRLSRGLTLSIREKEYVKAAYAIGVNNFLIIKRYILPNIMGSCLVNVTLSIPGLIATEAFLSFIGLGVLYPGLLLALTMLSFNFLGDGLRDALDPKIKS